MLAQEAIIREGTVEVVTIYHLGQREAVAACRAAGLDPYERIPTNQPPPEGCDILLFVERWENHLATGPAQG